MARVRTTANCYLAELYAPRRGVGQQQAEAERIRLAVEALVGAGVAIRYLRSIVVPREETAFHLFEAERASAVEQVLHDVGLEAECISLASTVGVPESKNAAARNGRLPSH